MMQGFRKIWVATAWPDAYSIMSSEKELARFAVNHYHARHVAQVAELVDALASGASVHLDVEVQVLSWAPLI